MGADDCQNGLLSHSREQGSSGGGAMMGGGEGRGKRKRGRKGEEWSEEEGDKGSMLIQFLKKVSLSISAMDLKPV